MIGIDGIQVHVQFPNDWSNRCSGMDKLVHRQACGKYREVAQVACNLWGPQAVETTPRVAHATTPPCHAFVGEPGIGEEGDVGALRDLPQRSGTQR